MAFDSGEKFGESGCWVCDGYAAGGTNQFELCAEHYEPFRLFAERQADCDRLWDHYKRTHDAYCQALAEVSDALNKLEQGPAGDG